MLYSYQTREKHIKAIRREKASLTREHRRNENRQSTRQYRSRKQNDTSLERTKETQPSCSGHISRRTLLRQVESSRIRKLASRSRLSAEAVVATRNHDRHRKKITQLQTGLEWYETFKRIICNPAEHRCSLCSRLMYEISLTNSRLTAQQIRFLKSSGYSFTIG